MPNRTSARLVIKVIPPVSKHTLQYKRNDVLRICNEIVRGMFIVSKVKAKRFDINPYVKHHITTLLGTSILSRMCIKLITLRLTLFIKRLQNATCDTI